MQTFVKEHITRKALRLSVPTPKVVPVPTKRSIVYKLGRRVEIQGVATKFYNLSDMSKFWSEITYSHVRAWYRVGILPEPYMMRELYNGNTSPLWLREQVIRIHEIVNNHWLRGFPKLTWRYRRTVSLLHERTNDAKDRFERKLEREFVRLQTPSTGVRWIDSPEFGVKPGYDTTERYHFDYDDS